MTTETLCDTLTTTQAAEKAGLTRQGILRRGAVGTLVPVYQLHGNGSYLFACDDIEAAA